MTARTPHRRFRASDSNGQAKRGIAAATLLLLAGFQLLTWLHFILIPHAVDARTGKVVHVRDISNESEPSSDTSDTDSSDRSDNTCHVLALLCTAKAVILSDAHVPRPISFVEMSVFVPDISIIFDRQLYLLSPSHSPPTLSLG